MAEAQLRLGYARVRLLPSVKNFNIVHCVNILMQLTELHDMMLAVQLSRAVHPSRATSPDFTLPWLAVAIDVDTSLLANLVRQLGELGMRVQVLCS